MSPRQRFGTTEAALIAAALTVDSDERRLWRSTLSPGAPPSVVQGAISIKALRENQAVAVTATGALDDPRLRAFAPDEPPRANPTTATTGRRCTPASTPVSRRRSRGGSRNIRRSRSC